MKSLVIYGAGNSRGKHDGEWFQRKAMEWLERHGGAAVGIDTTRPKADRFRDVMAAVELHQPQLLAVCDHGLRNCLPRLGITCVPLPRLQMPERNVDTFTAALAAAGTHVRLELFACSAGDDLVPGEEGPPGGDFGFADQSRDSLVKHGAYGAQVDAHTRAGESVSNPYVRRFSGPEDKQHVGGYMIVEPDSPLFHRWDRWLDAGGWKDFPTMSVDEIHARLEAA